MKGASASLWDCYPQPMRKTPLLAVSWVLSPSASSLRYLILRDLESIHEKLMFFVIDNLKEVADELRRVSIMKRIRKL